MHTSIIGIVVPKLCKLYDTSHSSIQFKITFGIANIA